MSPSREGMPRPHATRGGKRTVIVSEVLDEGTLLEALRELWDPKQPPSLQDLARVLTKKGTLRGPDPISPRWVGTALRQRLGIRTERHRDGYRVAGGQERQVSGLFVRFGTLS